MGISMVLKKSGLTCVKEELTSAGFVAPAKMTLLLQPKPLSGTTLASATPSTPGSARKRSTRFSFVSLALRRGNFQLAKSRSASMMSAVWKPASTERMFFRLRTKSIAPTSNTRRERHLRDNQTAAEAETLAASRQIPAGRLERRRWSDASGAEGGSHSEKNRGQQRDHHGKGEHSPIRPEVNEDVGALVPMNATKKRLIHCASSAPRTAPAEPAAGFPRTIGGPDARATRRAKGAR